MTRQLKMTKQAVAARKRYRAKRGGALKKSKKQAGSFDYGDIAGAIGELGVEEVIEYLAKKFGYSLEK